jgi:hypothetical protein
MVRTMGARRNTGPKAEKRISFLKLLRDYPDYVPDVSRGHSAPETNAILEASRNKCREWAQQLEENRRSSTALQFTSRALYALADELHVTGAVRLRLGEQLAALDEEALNLAEGLGRAAASLPVDEALYYVTSLYPTLLSQDTRSKLGAFYTP